MKKLRITVDGRAYDVAVEEIADDGVGLANAAEVAIPTAPAGRGVTNAAAAAAPTAKPASKWPAPSAAAVGRDVASQVSGMVVDVEVAVGSQVTEGQRLVTIEAMKMNTYVLAPFGGNVTEVLVAKGKSVSAGDVLLRLS
jgi:biotin carboxyl carrier protein